MPITTTNITGKVYLPDGSSPVNGKVVFELTSWDREEGEALFVTGPYITDIDDVGGVDIDLFTTTEGTNSVTYRMSVVYRDPLFHDHVFNNTKTEYIGFFSLSGPGPFRLSELDITSEYVPTSFDLYSEIKTYQTTITNQVEQTTRNAEAAEDSAFKAALYDGPKVDSITELASVTPEMLGVGEYIRCISGGWVYQRADDDATDPGLLDYTGSGGVKLEVLAGANGRYQMAAWGLDETGATDVSAAFCSAIVAARKIDLTPDAVYRFNVPQVIEDVPGLDINWNGARLYTTAPIPAGVPRSAVLTIQGSAFAQVRNFDGYGDEDFNSWQALAANQQMQDRTILRLVNCPYARVYAPRTEGFVSGVAVDTGCIDSVVYDPVHKGIMGLRTNAPSNYNFAGAGVIMRGAHGSTVYNPQASECAQTVLGLYSIEQLRVFGGRGDEIHNVGVYISSGFDCLVQGFIGEYCRDEVVKARGSRNVIAHCHGLEGDAAIGCAFVISGLALPDAVDSLGACGHGSKILHCTAKDFGALAEARKVDIEGTNRSMRDIDIHGNTGINMTNAFNRSPILVWAVRGARVNDNEINGCLAGDSIMLIGGPQAEAVIADSVGFEASRNTFRNTERGVHIQSANRPVADDNRGHNMAIGTLARFFACTSPHARRNTSDTTGASQIVDIRAGSLSNTGIAVATDNDGFVYADTDQQWFGANNYSQALTDTSTVTPTRRGQIVRSTVDSKTHIAVGQGGLHWKLLE